MLAGTVQITGAQPASGIQKSRDSSSGRHRSPNKKVVLFLPPYSGPPLGPPAGLLALASPLRGAGYQVKIVDAAVEPDYAAAIERETTNALCFGVSLLTGPMIEGAIEVSRLVKRRRPDLPIIYGGWHPSLLPEQTLREPFVDAVVRHQGEITFLELVRRLQDGRSLEGVAGCWFKREGRIFRNADRPAARISELPMPDYGQADFDAYERAGGGRKLAYATSVGCPYACTYCTDTVFYNRRFNAYPAERVVSEVTRLAAEHRLDEVALLDSNFLVDTKRAVRIAEGFLASGLRFRWTFQASTDLLCRLSDEEVDLLGRSGVTHIGFGTESGSAHVLELMNKPHQTIPDMFETARKCRRAGIRVTFNLIFGYPGETEAHRWETLRVMGEIGTRFENVTFSPNLFTPYPGIPVWLELERLGMKQPDSLEGWRQTSLGVNTLPWIKGAPYDRLRESMLLLSLANELTMRIQRTKSWTKGALLRILRRPLCWRLRQQFYGWPVEVWLYQLRKRLVMRRSLLTGQRLGYSMDHTC